MNSRTISKVLCIASLLVSFSGGKARCCAEEPADPSVTLKFLNEFRGHKDEIVVIARTKPRKLIAYTYSPDTGLYVFGLMDDGPRIYRAEMRDSKFDTTVFYDFNVLLDSTDERGANSFVKTCMFPTMDGIIHPKFLEKYAGNKLKRVCDDMIDSGVAKRGDEKCDTYKHKRYGDVVYTFSPKDGFIRHQAQNPVEGAKAEASCVGAPSKEELALLDKFVSHLNVKKDSIEDGTKELFKKPNDGPLASE